MTASVNPRNPTAYLSQLIASHQLLCLFLAGLLLVLISSLITNYAVAHHNKAKSMEALFFERDFQRSPFGLMDANDVCKIEAEQHLGTLLLRSHLDPLSTRYEDKRNRYLVVLNADVGSVRLWQEVRIFCDVNPTAREVAYYKEAYDHDISLLSRTMGIFNSLLN